MEKFNLIRGSEEIDDPGFALRGSEEIDDPGFALKDGQALGPVALPTVVEMPPVTVVA